MDEWNTFSDQLKRHLEQIERKKQRIHAELITLRRHLQITVKLIRNKIILNVNSSDTIESIKAKAAEKDGIPSHQIDLIFLGRRLKNELTLSDYNIQNGSVLDVIFSLHGGNH